MMTAILAHFIKELIEKYNSIHELEGENGELSSNQQDFGEDSYRVFPHTFFILFPSNIEKLIRHAELRLPII